MERLGEAKKQEYDFLDTKELEPLITSHDLVGDVMDFIESQFREEYKSKYPDDEIFNAIDEYDFAEYISERYGIKTYEVTEIRLRGD